MKKHLLTLGRAAAAIVATSAFICAQAAELTATFKSQSGQPDWFSPSTWIEGVVPNNGGGNTYNVVIDQQRVTDFVQVLADNNVTISRLDLVGTVFTGVNRPAQFRVLDFFQFRGGTLTGNGSVYRIWNTEFSGPLTKYLAGGQLHMNGLARWTGGNLDFSMYGYVELHPESTLSIETSGFFGAEGNTSSASVLNNGIIRLNAPNGISRWGSAVTNGATGLIDLADGELWWVGSFGGAGHTRIGPNAVMRARFLNSFNGMTVENAGVVHLMGWSTTDKGIEIPGKVILTGGIGGTGNVTVGNWEWREGNLDGPGALVIPVGGSFETYGLTLPLNRSFSNDGQLIVRQGSRPRGFQESTNDSSGVIALESDTQLTTGAIVNRGKIVKDKSQGIAELLSASISNSGVIRAEGGQLTIQGPVTGGTVDANAGAKILLMNNASGIVATGSGTMVFGGVVDAQLGTNLNLAFGNVTLPSAPNLNVRALEVAGAIQPEQPGVIRVREELYISRGSLAQVELSSEGATTLDIFGGTLGLSNGGELKLEGTSTWTGGNVLIASDGLLRNNGTLRATGSGALMIQGSGRFENSGEVVGAPTLGGLAINIGTAQSILQSVAGGAATPINPSNFGLKGQVSLRMGNDALTGRDASINVSTLVASPNLSTPSSVINLSNSVLRATQALNLTNVSLLLDRSQVVTPPNGLRGSFTLQGNGSITGDVEIGQSTFQPGVSNLIQVEGNLTLVSNNNSFLTVVVDRGSTGIAAPHLKVSGSVVVGGRLDVLLTSAAKFFPIVPVISIVESESAIRGAFANIQSGGTLMTIGGTYKLRVFYGEGSPFGANKIVLADIGTPYDRWLATRFTAGQLLDPVISGPDADPDGNGFSNLIDFVFAIDRPVNAPSVLPNAEAGYSLLSVRIRSEGEMLSPMVAFSTDLTAWTNLVLGADAGSLRLQRIFDNGEVKTFWYRYPGPPNSLFVRASAVFQ